MKYLLSLIALAIFIAPSAHAAELHRFYSQEYKGHFYTQSSTEKQIVSANDEWEYEGVAYNVSGTGDTVPVYRFWSDNFKHHFFTTSLSERDSIIQTDDNWEYEGESFKVRSQGTPVYRFYSPVFKGHFYTASITEKDNLQENDPNWNYEGVAWHVGEDDDANANESITPESLTITITDDEDETLTEEGIAERIIIENNINIENIIGELPCFRQSDIDGDGWGWNGKEGCKIRGYQKEEKISVCPASPVFRYFHDTNENSSYDAGEDYEWSTSLSNANVKQIYKDSIKISEDHSTLIDQPGSYHYFSYYYYGHTTREAGNSIQTRAYFDVDEYCNVSYPEGQDISYVLETGEGFDETISCSQEQISSAQFTFYVDDNQNGTFDDWENHQVGSYWSAPGGATLIFRDGGTTPADEGYIPGDYSVGTAGNGANANTSFKFRINNSCVVEYTEGQEISYSPGRFYEPAFNPNIRCENVETEFTFFYDDNDNGEIDDDDRQYLGTHASVQGGSVYMSREGGGIRDPFNGPYGFFNLIPGRYTTTGVGGHGQSTSAQIQVNNDCSIDYPNGQVIQAYSGR